MMKLNNKPRKMTDWEKLVDWLIAAELGGKGKCTQPGDNDRDDDDVDGEDGEDDNDNFRDDDDHDRDEDDDDDWTL